MQLKTFEKPGTVNFKKDFKVTDHGALYTSMRYLHNHDRNWNHVCNKIDN